MTRHLKQCCRIMGGIRLSAMKLHIKIESYHHVWCALNNCRPKIHLYSINMVLHIEPFEPSLFDQVMQRASVGIPRVDISLPFIMPARNQKLMN